MIDRMHDMESSYAGQAEELKAMAVEYASTAREKIELGTEQLKAYVLREPVKAIGMAVGIGVALGWMIKRR